MDEGVLRQVQNLGARVAAIIAQPPAEGSGQDAKKADEGFGLKSIFLFWKNL